MIDAIDRAILQILQKEGRITNAELAQRVGLSPGPTLTRVHKLEDAGYILGYCAQLDRESLGLPVTAFVSVICKNHGLVESEEFFAAVEAMPEVMEVHHIAGEEDYLLKVVAASPADYERFVLEKLTAIDVVQRVKTTFVLSTRKSTTAIPVRKEQAE